jgi:nucleoside-triphosphatase
MSAKNILITGPPGCGKTTLVQRFCDSWGHAGLAGFYTEEIREGGRRLGFSMVDFTGRADVLAHVDFPGRPRVGKYGVAVATFESFLASIPFIAPATRLIVIDEIGKMECLSTVFQNLIGELLDQPTPVLATVALRGGGLIAAIKERPDVELLHLTARNRDALVEDLLVRIGS